MRILLTNHALAERSGTELYIRDVALALLERGHEPVAYSRRLGEVADELRRATVPVVDDLAKLGRAPDVIHAQHHLEAMTALAYFPDVPSVYVCHGWLPAPEAPPRHPRLLHYAAVDALVRQRLIDECGVEPDRTSLLLNFVDLERFKSRGPLPEEPKKALVFSNYVSEENCLDALRLACLQAGLELDVIGRGHGAAESAPEKRLGDYDVVFAKGRSALEAAAVGAAVVLCDAVGLGPMVTSDDFDRLRDYNFGVRLLRQEVTAQQVLSELGRYDATDAAEVSQKLRQQASIDATVDRLTDLYRRVQEESRREDFDPAHASRAFSGYLRHGPLTGGDMHAAERERLLAEVAHQKARVAEIRQVLESRDQERQEQAAELMQWRAHYSSLEAERDQLSEQAEAFRLWAVEAEDIGKSTEQQIAALKQELEAAQLALAEDRAKLEAEQASRKAAEKRTELAETRAEDETRQRRWMESSVSWRLRGALLALPGVGAIARALLRRKATGGASRPD